MLDKIMWIGLGIIFLVLVPTLAVIALVIMMAVIMAGSAR